MIAEAPAAHRSPVTKPHKPTAHKAPRPHKPTTPKTHEKHQAPSRDHKGGHDKTKKEAPKKSAGLDERDDAELEIGGGARLRIPSLGRLPN